MVYKLWLMNFSYYTKQAQRFGLKMAAYELCIRVLEKVAPYHEYICLSLRFRSQPIGLKEEALGAFSNFEFKKIPLTELEKLAEDRSLDLPGSFLEVLENRDDVCFGLFEKSSGLLVCYSFFATQATEVHSQYFFQFPAKWVYVYKSFTHPRYRGKGLLPYVLKQAVPSFEGLFGYITMIQAHNLASLRAFESIGFHRVQSFHMLKVPGRPWSMYSFAHIEEGVQLSKVEP